MLHKIAQALPPSPTLSQASSGTHSYAANKPATSCRELVELFRRVASTKQKNLPLDLPAEFIRNLMAANQIIESQRAEDFERLLECVDVMVAVLKVRSARLSSCNLPERYFVQRSTDAI
jgi:hypothetical protein